MYTHARARKEWIRVLLLRWVGLDFHVLHLVFYSLKLLDVSNGWGHGTCLTETEMYNEALE